jgi:hypothetical protein
MFVILLFCLLPSVSFAADLQDLVSASDDFEVEMIEHEHMLERCPKLDTEYDGVREYQGAKNRFVDATF